MSTDRAHPSEELNPGAETPPRVAASVIVLRDSPHGPEVLLVQRNPAARFMGGAWVFPGGAVDEGEQVEQTALRELHEEASIELSDTTALAPFSRWITPAEVTIRFDTHFFLAVLPPGQLRSYTPRTITDRRELEAELERVRRRGHAEALGERLVEAEINPLFVGRTGEGVRAVDGLAVLGKS